MAKKTKQSDQEELRKALEQSVVDESENSDDDEQDEPKSDRGENQPLPTGPAKTAKPTGTQHKEKGDATSTDRASDRTAKSTGRQRRRFVIMAVVGLVVLGGAAGAGVALFGTKPAGTNTTQALPTSGSDLVPRRIDGVLDNPEEQNRYPVAVMVENHPASRPQSGLEQAKVVFEALAEGGITRFLAVYTFNDAVKEIGPVRSARPYFVDWARGFNAMYVHIGGSAKALSRITQLQAFDLNQFFNSQYFYRDRSREVASEHTLYTTKRLMQLALLDKDAPKAGDFQAWKFKAEAPASSRPSSQHLTIDFSTFSYKVDYEYDPVTNTYARSLAEQPHVVRDGGQLRPKNVIVMTVKRRLEQPVDGQGRLEMDTVGEGPVRIFLDGRELVGTWKKASPQDQLHFYGPDGQPVELNSGQTWIEAVPPEQGVSVS
ncbi:MAG: DUF3048 domain-containing protein [Candidatus Kerfeldbacteria bacterium]|nr:DUF3048 domain-containing protein [Candidatus Kerfeldbacteria bacterium]